MQNLNFIIHEPADEYHARSRSGEFTPETAARRLAAPARVGTAGGRNRGRCGSG